MTTRDEAAISLHLAGVERALRARPAPDAEHAAIRAQLLDELHRYRLAAVYPHNPGLAAHPRRVVQPAMYDGGPGAVPIFIDAHGHPCAVADLVLASGATALAWRVASEANTAYLHDMSVEGLGEWVAGSGFTLDELAAIQPEYPPPVPWPPLGPTCDIDDLEAKRGLHERGTEREELPLSYQRCLAREIATEQDPERLGRIVKFLDDRALPASASAEWEDALRARIVPLPWPLHRVALRHLDAFTRRPERLADAAELVAALAPSFDAGMAVACPEDDPHAYVDWCRARRPECRVSPQQRSPECLGLLQHCIREMEAWRDEREDDVACAPSADDPPPLAKVAPPPAPPAAAGWSRFGWGIAAALGAGAGALALWRKRGWQR